VLFADLVGSTTLAESLDDAEVKLVVGDAIARVVVEIERLGGYVKDLAGDGVLAFFGAPTASEDDAERALLAGLAILEAMSAYAAEVERGWGVQGFGVRVGITTGPVVVGALGAGGRVEYAAFGDTVNTAARLQAAAEPGTILADEQTRRLAEPLFDWEAPVEHELKGKQRPVVAHRPLRARPDSVKPRGLAGVDTELVGRERELGLVREALEAVEAGRGGVLLVTGEAGIGKSRLLLEARKGYDGLWLEGRCVSYGESLPYWPFRDLAREWLGVGLDDPELRVRVTLRRAVAELFGERELEIYPYLCALLGTAPEPDAAARLADLSPEALQYRTFEVVEALLERIAEERPATVLLDDLHWADTTSVQLVERLLAVGERGAVLLVVMQRDDRDHPSWAVRERAAREVPHLLTEVRLEPLSGDAQRELLETAIGSETLPGELEERILAAAEGNPFYLEELVRSLIDAGAIVREDGRWRLDHEVPVEVPPTVERVVLARIDRLTPGCHEVLTAASALGRRFGLQLLQAVLEDRSGMEEALHELQRLDLLRTTRAGPQAEFRFKHALIQESAYRTLLPDRRRALHRAAAEWLERQHEGGGEVLGLLAHHWLEAADEEKAIVYLTRAADRARLAWGLDEAIEHYRKLLALLERRGENAQRALVLFKLGLALHTALRFAEANRAFTQAFELWTPPTDHPSPTAILRVASGRLPREGDPPRSYNLPDMMLQMALFDRLVERWPESTIVPSLAERWEVSDDGLRYLFRLREGLRWSDGHPLTASDVEYGIKRGLDPERPGVSVSIYYVIENAQEYALGRSSDASRIGVRALDERTVEFRLAAPAPYFLSVVNRPDGGPQPRHAIERYGDAWLDPAHAVVSGAFRVAERNEGRLVLERRAGSVPRAGNVGRVEIRQEGDERLELLYGRDDADLVAFPSLSPSLPEADRIFGAAAGSTYLAFDHRHPATSRAELRRALACALDRDSLVDAFGREPGVIPATGGIVPPALQGHTPDIALRFDPDSAREAIARAGLTEPLVLFGSPHPLYARIVEAVHECWASVLPGVVEMRLLTSDELARLSAAEAGPDAFWSYGQILVEGWYPGYPDPEYFLRLLLHSDSTDNRGRWTHAPFDELIEAARREPDGRRRLELFHEADRMAVAEQAAVIPLRYSGSAFFAKPRVHGWWEYGKSWPSFADLILNESRE
jgi:ABC-type oligopeptide transport system substrate-binding subunit/class 3 adenylate cyclase